MIKIAINDNQSVSLNFQGWLRNKVDFSTVRKRGKKKTKWQYHFRYYLLIQIKPSIYPFYYLQLRMYSFFLGGLLEGIPKELPDTPFLREEELQKYIDTFKQTGFG